MEKNKNQVVVLDFETTGLSANYERVIEVGAALVEDNKIIKTFSTLCDPGRNIPYFISDITGITNRMVKGQPRTEEVMPELHKFIGQRPILAHNASFDSQFLHAEMERTGKKISNPFLCTMLLSRRLIQEAPNHKLGTLKRYISFKEEGGHQDHRALDDVKVTVALWSFLRKKVEVMSGCKTLDVKLYSRISRMPKKSVESRLSKMLAQFS